jgi:hypothetical protein
MKHKAETENKGFSATPDEPADGGRTMLGKADT